MAEFILKDQYGKEKVFDQDKIFVRGTDGGLVQFTEGTGDAPAVVQPLEVTENGTYAAPDGVDGYSPVTVNVDPTKITIFKEKEMVGFALDNQLGYLKEEYPPSFTPTVGEKYSVAWDGVVYDNLAVTDASAVVSGAVYIGNGSAYGLPGNNEPFAILYMYGALGYCAFDDSSESHTIGVWKKVVQEINLQDKTITENGTYTADSGYDGLGSVTVEVAGSGGGAANVAFGIVPSSSVGTVQTITHGLGVVPNIILVENIDGGVGTKGKKIGFFSMSRAFATQFGFSTYFKYTSIYDSYGAWRRYNGGDGYMDELTGEFVISNVNEETFLMPAMDSRNYFWIAVAGLV